MSRFTIRRKGSIMGTYPGKDEGEALDALAVDENYDDFADSCEKKKLKRDDYTVEKVEE